MCVCVYVCVCVCVCDIGKKVVGSEKGLNTQERDRERRRIQRRKWEEDSSIGEAGSG